MKKKTVSPKKRTVRRRKQQRLKKRQRSLQRRLARLAKAQRPFNSLVAALAKASASAVTLVESEKLRQLPGLGKAVLNINLDTQDAPKSLQMQPPAAQRSLQGSLSLPQRLTSTLQVESSVLCRETVLLWVVPRHSWPLSPVGCRPSPPECQPCLLTHVGEPVFSAAGSSALLALTLPTDSRPIAVEPPAEKRLQEASLIPSCAPGVPAARWTAAYQQAPAAAPKPTSAAPVADKLPGAEQSPADDETEWVDYEVFFENLGTVYKSHQAGQPLRKAFVCIKKLCRRHKKPIFQGIRRSTKSQRHCLDKTGFFITRARARFSAASSLCVNPVKLSYRKHRGCSRRLTKTTKKINIDIHTHHSPVSFIRKPRLVRNHSNDVVPPESETALNGDVMMSHLVDHMAADCSQMMAVDAATGAQNVMSEEAPVGHALQLVRGQRLSPAHPLVVDCQWIL
jgi:hypothetical protein